MAKKTKKRCPYICLYESYLVELSPYSDEERGRLITAMLRYMYHDELPEFEGNERYIWLSLKGQLDRDREAYEERCKANRANGAKGGRPKKKEAAKTEGLFSETQKTEGLFSETQKTEGLFLKPKKPKEKENENEKEKEKENENEKESEREKEMPQAAADTANTPYVIPDEKDIFDYCNKEGLYVNVRRFMDYYAALGWRLGGQPIYDWRPLVRRWSQTEYDPEKPYGDTLALIEKFKREPWQSCLRPTSGDG